MTSIADCGAKLVPDYRRTGSGSFGDTDGMRRAGSGAPPGLLLIIDVAERLPVIVADDEARAVVFDRPWRRESALCHYLPVHRRAASKITSAGDDEAQRESEEWRHGDHVRCCLSLWALVIQAAQRG